MLFNIYTLFRAGRFRKYNILIFRPSPRRGGDTLSRIVSDARRYRPRFIDWFVSARGGDDGVYITGDRLLARKIIIRFIHFFFIFSSLGRVSSSFFRSLRARKNEKKTRKNIIKLVPFIGREKIALVAYIIYTDHNTPRR